MIFTARGGSQDGNGLLLSGLPLMWSRVRGVIYMFFSSASGGAALTYGFLGSFWDYGPLGFGVSVVTPRRGLLLLVVPFPTLSLRREKKGSIWEFVIIDLSTIDWIICMHGLICNLIFQFPSFGLR